MPHSLQSFCLSFFTSHPYFSRSSSICLGHFSCLERIEKKERTRRGSQATAAFQAGRLIPFLARQKTKGHLEGYEGRKMWQDHTRWKKSRASSSQGRDDKREERREKRRRKASLGYIPVRKRPRFIPPEARYPRAKCLTDC